MENCGEPEDGDHRPDKSFELKPKVSKELQVSFRRIQHCALILLSENIKQVTMINM